MERLWALAFTSTKVNGYIKAKAIGNCLRLKLEVEGHQIRIRQAYEMIKIILTIQVNNKLLVILFL